MKKFLSVLTVLLLLVSLASCSRSQNQGGAAQDRAAGGAADGQEFVLKAGHTVAADHPYQMGLEYLNDLLVERTGGKMRLEIFPGAQLGAERELFEGAQIGTVDLALGSTSPLANFESSFSIFDLPYLFDDNAHAWRVMDGSFGQAKFDTLEKVGLVGLAYWDAGWHPIINSKNTWNLPTDCAGQNIRVLENDIFMEFIKAMDSNPVPMPFSEVFTAVQNGTVDGASVSVSTIFTSKLYTVAPYLNCIFAIYAPNPLIMSKRSWDRLPPEYQQILKQAAIEARDYEREVMYRLEEEYIEQMRTEGTNVRLYTPEERKVWEAFFKPRVWDKLVGTKLLQSDVDAIAAQR